MLALVVGVILILAAVYLVLPVAWSPGWLDALVVFVKGSVPVIGFFVGLLAILIGLADIKDRREARKEQKEQSGNH